MAKLESNAAVLSNIPIRLIFFRSYKSSLDPGVATLIQHARYPAPPEAPKSSPEPTPSKLSTNGLNKAAIAGGSVGGLIAVICLSVLLILHFRRQRRKSRALNHDKPPDTVLRQHSAQLSELHSMDRQHEIDSQCLQEMSTERRAELP